MTRQFLSAAFLGIAISLSAEPAAAPGEAQPATAPMAAPAEAQATGVVPAAAPAAAAVPSAVASEVPTAAASPALAPEVAAAAAAAPAPTPSEKTKDPDGGWPRMAASEGGTKIVMHQPQIEVWKDQKTLVAWAAIEYLLAGRDASALGTAKLEAQTSVAIEERLVKLEKIQVKQVNFPNLDQSKTRDITTTLNNRLRKDGLVIALDRILAAMDKSSVMTQGTKINQEPPPIFYSKKPAVLVVFDGDPIKSPIEKSTLKWAVNTNWDVLFEPDEKKYYLRNGKNWFATENLEKDWLPVKKLPASFATLPKDDANWDEVRKNMPPKSIGKSKAPKIFVSMRPAELIVTKGKPKKERVAKSKLYWIKNTECDVFVMKRGKYYVLVSGRWFSSKKLTGPWKFATTELPKEFQSIPRTHERAHVRASIPGTEEAAEAVVLANIPRTLRVERQGLQTPEVKYDGEPRFQEIKGTKVSYAVNTLLDVLKVGEAYFLCSQGAWFVSKSAHGPWSLADRVPNEIYSIPPESPMYHVTYVKIQSADAGGVVYEQTAGYSGVTVSFGVAMYGTGWYYPPYYGYGGSYPVYYPYPHSYGSYAVYNSRTGAYGYGSTVAGPNGGISRAATYNPNTGTYARGAKGYSSATGTARGAAQAYNPRTGTSMETRQGRSSDGSWGSTKVQRGDDWVQRGHASGEKGSVSGVRTSEGSGVIRGEGADGSSGFVGKHGDDVYAGKDGNVYKKTEDGWQQHGEGGWTDVEKPSERAQAGTSDRQGRDRQSAGTHDQLSRDAGARQQGNQRVQQNRGSGSYSGNRGSSGASRGSYGGGGSRGGGGRGGGRR